MIEILIDGMTRSVGGKETYIVNTYKAFDRTKYRFTFVASDEKIAYEDYLNETGSEIVHLPKRHDGLLAYRKAIDNLFSSRNFDVVWSNTTSLYKCEIIEYAYKHKIPVRIVHSHSSSNMGGRLTYVFHNLNKMLIKKWANEFFACSYNAGKWFYGNRPCRIIKNGIDTGKFSFNPVIRDRIRNELKLGDDFVLVHVGRFGPEKNHKKLISVFNELHNLNSASKLVLCGDGAERANIEKQISELGLTDCVLVLGAINNVNEMLQACDVMVMPSLFEGLPFAIIEAQTSGLRCVVSETISKESDILGCNVFLPLEADDAVWAKAVLECKSDNRAEAADKIRKKGFDVYDCTSCVEQIIQSYLTVE